MARLLPDVSFNTAVQQQAAAQAALPVLYTQNSFVELHQGVLARLQHHRHRQLSSQAHRVASTSCSFHDRASFHTNTAVRCHRHTTALTKWACGHTSGLQDRYGCCNRATGMLQAPSSAQPFSRRLPLPCSIGWPYRNFSSRDHSSSSRSAAVNANVSISSSSSSSPRPPAATEISSAANPYIKHCVKLRQSAKYRQHRKRLLLVGSTLLAELAEDATQLEVLVLFLRPGAAPPAGVRAQHVIEVNEAVMKKLTGLEEAAGVTVVAELALPQYVDLSSLDNSSSSVMQVSSSHNSSSAIATAGISAHPQLQLQLQRLLVLEGVQDPGNLGTLLRCAAAFGWDAVWLLPGCCDPFNDKALRASRGAALRVPLAIGSLGELLAVVKQQNLLLLAAEPEPGQQSNIGNVQLSSSSQAAPATASSNQRPDAVSLSMQVPVCLVLGTEGAGLSQEVLSCAKPVSIPMSGRMESLNVGVAGAILMFALSDGMPQLLNTLQHLR